MRLSAATVSRKRAIATANGLRSTPWIASSAAWTRAWISRSGRVLVPAVQQAVEGAEQEVAGPAGGVDELEAFEGALLQRGFEGPVEDELLDEDRRLQQRVGVLGVLGQVLVQVAEEPRRQRLVRPGRGRGLPSSSRRRQKSSSAVTASPEGDDEAQRANAGRPAPSSRAGPRGNRRPASATRGRCPRDGRGRTRAGRRGPPAGGPPGPEIQTGLTSALSSQNRMNTLVSTQATAAWVTRSSRQATQDAAVRSLSTARWCSRFQSASRSASAATRRRRSSSRMQDLPLKVGGQGGRRGHDAPSAAGTRPWASIQSASRRKNWPGAASGSGSPVDDGALAPGQSAGRAPRSPAVGAWPGRPTGSAWSGGRTGRAARSRLAGRGGSLRARP